MKVGIYASFGGKDDSGIYSIDSFIELGKSLQLDVLDVRTDKGWGSPPGAVSGGKSSEVSTEFIADIKQKALQAGLSMGYLSSIGHFTGTVEENEALVAAAKADVETALFLGCSLLRCFTSCSGEYTLDTQRREVACFQELCDHALPQGVTIGMQNHPSTAEHMLRILKQVNRPNFAFVMDTGQWVGGANANGGPADESNYAYMEQCAPYTAHVRAKFFKVDQGGSESWLDYPRIVNILHRAGFNGTLGIVFEGGKVNRWTDREVFSACRDELRRLTMTTTETATLAKL